MNRFLQHFVDSNGDEKNTQQRHDHGPLSSGSSDWASQRVQEENHPPPPAAPAQAMAPLAEGAAAPRANTGHLDDIPLSSITTGTTYDTVDLFDDGNSAFPPAPPSQHQEQPQLPAQQQHHSYTETPTHDFYHDQQHEQLRNSHGHEQQHQQYQEPPYGNGYDDYYQQGYDQQQAYYDPQYQHQYGDQYQYTAEEYAQYYQSHSQASGDSATAYTQEEYAQQQQQQQQGYAPGYAEEYPQPPPGSTGTGTETSTSVAHEESSGAADSFFQSQSHSSHSSADSLFGQPAVAMKDESSPSMDDPFASTSGSDPFTTKTTPPTTTSDPFAQPPVAPFSSTTDIFQQPHSHQEQEPALSLSPFDTPSSPPVAAQDLFSSHGSATAAAGDVSALFGSSSSAPTHSSFGDDTSFSSSSVAGPPPTDDASVAPPTALMAALTVSSPTELFVSDTKPVPGPIPGPVPSPVEAVKQLHTAQLPPFQSVDEPEPEKPMATIRTTSSSTTTTLDDTIRLAGLYKQMAERLETEKSELMQVLADQADQFYQMQDYIHSLERELAEFRAAKAHH